MIYKIRSFREIKEKTLTAIDLSLTRDITRHDGSLLTWYHDLNAVTLADHYNKTDINSQNTVY